ncbi:DUF1801 domain-containing protein [Salegentibacter sp. BDJ18]|uniref:DUF1801 domain-containing protein n=1 Tax=Salegentibacter sp. BDJ18 TaxID=2816376 RepID=UPI001AAE4E8C|nr:DUF1801 domain-containing protein [Salegentibacter sp. BDJ18]MBO2542875.1 DUF1801 domain-containing protein [Salegentibacter sp. BDJ18]
MKTSIKTDPRLEEVFKNYPDFIRPQLEYLRILIRKTAEETEGVTQLEETLKWNEPSFITKNGSTLRIDWKEKQPDQYAMYFHCSSRLIDTFRLVFNDEFNFEGKRAIIFRIDQELPETELKQCIKTAITYHKVKHLVTLGL